MSEDAFEPTIVGFLCNWCAYAGADLAGVSRLQYPPNLRTIRTLCSATVRPDHILKAFQKGADGVLISGCHPGECHYLEQNYKALRRYHLLRRTLEQFGIEPGRLKLAWASAAEGTQLAEKITEMVEEVRALGPLNWPGVVDAEGNGGAHSANPAPQAEEVSA